MEDFSSHGALCMLMNRLQEGYPNETPGFADGLDGNGNVRSTTDLHQNLFCL